jgi:hypothetical protein
LMRCAAAIPPQCASESLGPQLPIRASDNGTMTA